MLVINPFKFLLIAFVLLMSSASFVSLSAKTVDSRAAAIIDNQIITYQQVIDPIKNDLYQAELKVYNLKFTQLKNMLLNRLIQSDPLSKGMTADSYIDQYILNDIQATAAEIEQFIRARQIPAEKINQELRSQIHDYIISQKESQIISAWLKKKGAAHGLVINLSKPERPRIEIPINGAPTLGKDDAVVTLIEYSDFQCPYCSKAEATIKQLQKNYPGKIKLVYKQFPLGFHQDAQKAAEASLCANEQSTDYFWKLHEYMFANPRNLSTENLIAQASQMGMDKDRFSRCLTTGKFYTQVQQDIIEGQKYGVSSTPMFFINGIVVKGAQPYANFAKIIEEELE